MRIALGQVDATVGDLPGNVDLLTAWASRATEADADVIVFPELAITGYPPEDLVLRPAFVDDNLTALDALAANTAGGCSVVVGFVDRTERGIHNAAALVGGGEVIARYHKVKLPNYGVFDEARTFTPGDAACPVRLAGSELGLSVCEDAWMPGPPFDAYAERRTPVIVNINGSPFHRGKADERLRICRERALETGAWIVYVNAVGGQDELVFDGGSVVVRPDGTLAHHAAMFEEDLLVVDVDGEISSAKERPPWPEDLEQVYLGLVLGLRDYVRKNGFEQVVLGLSGGIDSAFVAVLARDALGPGAIRAVAMPSPYSSPESLEDARQVASRTRCPARRLRDRAGVRRLPGSAAGAVRGNQGRHRRGESAGAHPRQPVDGAVEQVRLARARDRQQERVCGRLRDAVRGHGRRVRTDQGRAEDARLPARRGGATRSGPRRPRRSRSG